MLDRSFLTWPFFYDSHRALADQIERWCSQRWSGELCEPHTDEDSQARELVRALGQAGWLKYSVPAPHGALPRLDVRSLCLIRETLARHAANADFSFAMQGLGSGPISLFGSNELKARYLSRVARGEALAAFALTEETGSDVASTVTTARRDGDAFIINGAKTWISNAGIADFYVVFARTGEAPGTRGLSAIVVDAATPGFKVSKRIAITSPHPVGSLTFTDCRVPAQNLVGAPGAGFKYAMATLDIFRSTVGAAALGFARRAMMEATAHAKSRKIFGQTLADFQLTQAALADMATDIDTSALLIYRAAWAKDSGAERVTREAAMAKMHATEAAQRVIDRAMQLLGGHGVVANSTLEHLYRDIRPLRIYEGTTEIQKLVIAKQVLEASQL